MLKKFNQHKLEPLRSGPCIVKELKGSNALIEDNAATQKTRQVHKNLLYRILELND